MNKISNFKSSDKKFFLNIKVNNFNDLSLNENAIKIKMNSFQNYEYFYNKLLEKLNVNNYHKFSKIDKMFLVENFLLKREINYIYIEDFENIFEWLNHATLAIFLTSIKDLVNSTNIKIYFNLDLNKLRKNFDKHSLYKFVVGDIYSQNKNKLSQVENNALNSYRETFRILLSILDFDIEDYENINISNLEEMQKFLQFK
jgi:hypothetical protein